MKKIPYGISDFQRIVEENYYYVDKTQYIEAIEASSSFLFMIRPRRFGKSLWLSVMESYYDVEMASRFDTLFGSYYIGKHPTDNRNKYLILKFNFSLVNPDPKELEDSFNFHCGERFRMFANRYAHFFAPGFKDELERIEKAEQKLEYIINRATERELSIYLIIDEYDNFSNVVLSRHGEDRYRALTHSAGFFRYFFNKLKGGTTGGNAAIKRMFITGVSPVTLDDVTSGFNIASHISMEPGFNSMLGFLEEEVAGILTYYKNEGRILREPDEILSVMREWYNNYCFSKSCCEQRVYNSDMVLYFINYLIKYGSFPELFVDVNIRTDYNKLRHLMTLDKHLNGNFSRIKQIAEEGKIVAVIESSFPAEDLIKPENFISLLFYFGILTIDREERGKTVLTVPNLAIREMLFSYIETGYRETKVFLPELAQLDRLMEGMAYEGKWQPVVDFFAGSLREQTSIRDFLQGEKSIQTLHMVYMSMTDYFTIWPEREFNKGYVDLWLEPNVWKHTNMKYGYLLEFKYLKQGTGDEEIEAALEAAKKQLRQYASDLRLKKGQQFPFLKSIAIVYRAWEMVRVEEVI